jgi:hypothetical protein
MLSALARGHESAATKHSYGCILLALVTLCAPRKLSRDAPTVDKLLRLQGHNEQPKPAKRLT